MKVLIVTPAPVGSRVGNRITALRWQKMLRGLSHRVRIRERWTSEEACDLLVAIHATKSATSIRQFRASHSDLPIVVGLAGTDLYVDLGHRADTQASIDLATRLIVLQPNALRSLDAAARAKARVILQSATRPSGRVARRRDCFLVVALGHLRTIKNPLLAAEAAELLPASSRIKIEHYGAALDQHLGKHARLISKRNGRWNWRGERSHIEATRILRTARLFVQTSQAEGGSSAIAEAVVTGLPILSARNDGAIGMLGRDHPGFFEPGDARALASLLQRCELDVEFLSRLKAASDRRAPLFAPERERAAWASLLDELR